MLKPVAISDFDHLEEKINKYIYLCMFVLLVYIYAYIQEAQTNSHKIATPLSYWL